MTEQALPKTSGRVRVPVRVMPRSSHNRIEGVRASRLLVRVTAPPVDAAANTAVIAVLAEAFGLPRQSIQIVSGATSRNKTIEITGLGDEAYRRWLAQLLESAP